MAAAARDTMITVTADAEFATDCEASLLAPSGETSQTGLALHWRKLCGLAALAGTAAIVAVAAAPHGGAHHRGAGAGVVAAGQMVQLDGVAEAAQPACAGAGQNCLTSKCCLDGGKEGLQCFAKNDFWAACVESCKKGVHANETHGTYDQYGKFQLDEWNCKQLGDRSKPGCETFAGEGSCPEGRCMWKGECMAACHNFGSEEACKPNSKCMWKGECMDECSTFDSEDTCKPSSKCAWKNGKCQQGCWTFGQDVCGTHDNCVWGGSECKDNCWTYFSEGTCHDHDRCMWNNDKCKPACSTFPTKDGCPAEFGCIWENPKENAQAVCMPDPCAAPGEDCTSSKCCSSQRGAAGMTCFKKDKSYATCMPACDKDDWSCSALGNRSIYEPGCGWAGKSCDKDQLCCNIGFNCVVKDDIFTGCVQTVQKSTWFAKKMPLPAGWRGTFVAGGRTEYSVPAAAEGQPVAGTTLYCFMAILPDSPEVTLMKVAKKNKASIFACDASDVLHSWQSAKAGWDTGEATLTNTDVFINVWDQVRKAGRYTDYEWTAKVDADAVLVPGRLKQHIAALRPPAGRAIYLKNNGMDKGLGNNGFLGAVEVFSRVAMQVYYDNAEGCHTTLGVNSGEDGFFKGCMDALGVGFMTDSNLFNPDFSPGACSNQGRAAFHPLKKPENWQCCVDILNGKPHNVVYGQCQLGYQLDLD